MRGWECGLQLCGWWVTGCATGTPAADDASCNNVDDDCNGATDEDYVADSSCFLPGACAAGNVASSCAAGGDGLCDGDAGSR